MTRFLLDTNVMSDLVHRPTGSARKRLDEVGGRSVYTSVVVAAELRYGVAKRRSARLVENVEKVLATILVVPFAVPADMIYGAIRSELEQRGTPIGANDLWIAAQALHDGSVLVTDNTREFARVPGLTVENWIER